MTTLRKFLIAGGALKHLSRQGPFDRLRRWAERARSSPWRGCRLLGSLKYAFIRLPTRQKAEFSPGTSTT